jgi:hypothetical protein
MQNVGMQNTLILFLHGGYGWDVSMEPLEAF